MTTKHTVHRDQLICVYDVLVKDKKTLTTKYGTRFCYIVMRLGRLSQIMYLYSFLRYSVLLCCVIVAFCLLLIYILPDLWYNIWFLRWPSCVFWFADTATFDENVILASQCYWSQRYHQEQIRYVRLCAFATDHIALRRSAKQGQN